MYMRPIVSSVVVMVLFVHIVQRTIERRRGVIGPNYDVVVAKIGMTLIPSFVPEYWEETENAMWRIFSALTTNTFARIQSGLGECRSNRAQRRVFRRIEQTVGDYSLIFGCPRV